MASDFLTTRKHVAMPLKLSSEFMISILEFILSYANKSNVKYLDMQNLRNLTSVVPLFRKLHENRDPTEGRGKGNSQENDEVKSEDSLGLNRMA